MTEVQPEIHAVASTLIEALPFMRRYLIKGLSLGALK